uniref:Uncharacterized protein n=1 Tax=Arundo donax TaxID=35708 RepID=A0A0A9C148_ARUDO
MRGGGGGISDSLCVYVLLRACFGRRVHACVVRHGIRWFWPREPLRCRN